MNKVIESLRKQIAPLEKEIAKHDKVYRKYKDGFSYEMVMSIRQVIQNLEDQIKRLEEIKDRAPSY